MKDLFVRLINFYNTNAKFHSLVITLEYAVIGALTSWTGGVPVTRSAWAALGAGLLGAVVGAGKRWLATNVATVGTPGPEPVSPKP